MRMTANVSTSGSHKAAIPAHSAEAKVSMRKRSRRRAPSARAPPMLLRARPPPTTPPSPHLPPKFPLNAHDLSACHPKNHWLSMIPSLLPPPWFDSNTTLCFRPVQPIFGAVFSSMICSSIVILLQFRYMISRAGRKLDWDGMAWHREGSCTVVSLEERGTFTMLMTLVC